MARTLSVLIVEDSEDDAELLLRVLRRGGFDPGSKTVDTGKDMRAALQERHWDVVLCDYRMPRFNAPAALELVKEEGVDAPFIVVSGVIKIADAIDMLKAGAHDFVDKDNLDRLIPAVERALCDAETRRQQERAEEALKESRRRFRDLIETTPDRVWEVDENAVYTYASPQVSDLLGYEPGEVVGKTPFDFMPSEEAERVAAEFGPIAAARKPFMLLENTNLHKSGRRVVLETSGVPVLDAEGRFRGYRGIDRDITERKQAEEALRESEQRFRDFSEVASDWFWETDEQYRFTYYSKNVPGTVGPDWVPTVGKTRFDLRSPDDADDEKWDAHRADLEARRPFSNFEYHVRDAGGTVRHARVSGKPLFDVEGTFLGHRGTGSDVSEQKRAEAALRRKIRQLAAAEETAHVGHWRWIVGAGIVEWSDELYRMHGFEPGSFEVSLEKAIGFYHPDDRDALRQYLDAAIETKEGIEFELRLLPSDSIVRHIWARAECELDSDGTVVALHGVAQDITERKKAERAMVETVHAISATVEMRDPYTAGHQRRVAELSVAIGEELGLDPAQIDGLRFGAMIHDIGKIWVPAEILNRPGTLLPAEFEIIKTHPEVGNQIIKNIDFPWPISEMVLQHHERLDGSGYPRGLKDGEICLEAKILAVADVVEAMAAHRPYRAALGPDSGLVEILEGKGRRYQAEVVEACVRLFRQKCFAWQI